MKVCTASFESNSCGLALNRLHYFSFNKTPFSRYLVHIYECVQHTHTALEAGGMYVALQQCMPFARFNLQN